MQSSHLINEESFASYCFVRLRAQTHSIVSTFSVCDVLLYYSIPGIRRGSRRLTLVVRTSKFLLLSGLVV